MLCLLASPASGQDDYRVTLSGHVRDAESGEELIGAHLYAPDLQIGTVTNQYGFFSLTLPAGRVHLVASYLGYDPLQLELDLREDRRLNIELTPVAYGLDSLEVVAERTGGIHEESRMSTIEVPVAQIEKTPVLLGEADLLKTLQLLPGTQSGTEGTSGLYVRGGGPDQNLILLDGAPVYNVSHLFGFFSVFNTDAVRHVSLTKGGFPARYGGRLSSVVEVSMKDGNMREFETEGAIGLIASRLTVQGPIQKDRTSFLVSGRRTYLDLLARPFLPPDEVFGYYFFDLNAKVNHIFSERDRLYLSFYGGDDRFYQRLDEDDGSNVDFDFGWGNLTSTLRWNHIFSNKLFGNFTLLHTRYRFQIDSENRTEDEARPEEEPVEEVFRLKYHSGIRDFGGRADFDFVPNPSHYVRFGGNLTQHRFSPGAVHLRETAGEETRQDTTIASSAAIPSLEGRLYVEDDVRLAPPLKVNAGVHASLLHVEGGTFASIEPRLSARYLLPNRWAMKASYARMQQYLHLLTNSSIGLPTDLWLPATTRVPPQRAWQGAVGVAHTFEGGAYELSLEGYYKEMEGLIEYEEGAAFAFGFSDDWQDKIERGSGRAYGLELFLQKQSGRMTGWLGYTLAWSDRHFAGLNEGRRFPYRYDRRHDVALTLSYQIKENIDLSFNWVYGTGIAVTMPKARYRRDTPDRLSTVPHPFYLQVDAYSDRNGYRMEPYHRLDAGVRFTTPTRNGERVLSLGLYNAYNHKNPFFIYFDASGGERVAKQISLFPIIPSIGYRFKF